MAKGLETPEGEDGGGARRNARGLRAHLARIDNMFVTRELFLRSDDRIRYLRITATTQKTMVAATAMAAVWLLSSTFGTLHLSTVIADKNLKIEQSKADYAELVDEIRDYEGRFAELTGALDANQAQLLALLEKAPENDGNSPAAQSGNDPALADGQTANFQNFLDGLRGLAGQTALLRDHIANMKTQLDTIQLAKQKVDNAHQLLLERLHGKDAELAELESERGQLNEEIVELKNALELAQRGIASSDAANSQALAQLDESTAQLAEVRDSRDRLQVELDEIRADLAEQERALAAARASKSEAVAQSSKKEDRLASLSRERDRLEKQVGALQEELRDANNRLLEGDTRRADYRRSVEELQSQLTEVERINDELSGREKTLKSALATADRRSNEAVRHSEEMTEQMASLKAQMLAMREEQIALIKQLSERTHGTVADAEALLTRLRLPVEDLLEEAGERLEGGKGGPFVPLSELSEEERRQDLSLLSTLVSLDNSLERLEAMRELLGAMPIGAPLDEFRITSGFGKRRDPLNGRKAMHYGIDLVGPYRSPLGTTADGVVTKAGWMAGYGRVVEVEHEFGFKTRYAHLKRISVKVGQRLERGDEVGQLGNSGRSTGPHLHYEVWYKGKRVNPYHYVKAEIDVLQE